MADPRRLERSPLPPRLPPLGDLGTRARTSPEEATAVADPSKTTVVRYGAYEAGVDRMSAALGARASKAPPPEVVDRFEAYFSAYADGSELALEAIHRDGYADWVDTFGGTDRVRPTDAAEAGLRVNAALHSVVADAKEGRLSPEQFGRERWQDVASSQLLDEAKERLTSGEFDWQRDVDRMQADELWTEDPILVPTPEGMKPLDENTIGGVMDRSIVSLVASNFWARQMMASDLGQTIANNAERVANAPPERRDLAAREANLDTAVALYNGQGIAKNANAALPAIMDLAEISPLGHLAMAPEGATKATLEREVEAGKIDGFLATENGLVTYRVKTPQQVAQQVAAKREMGMLDHLSPAARSQLDTLLGPPSAPGQTLADRLESEGAWSGYRQFASGVIDLAAVGVASGGVGAVAEGFAVGARLSAAAIRGARFVATSASFTTLMGAKSGDLSASAYAKDALMFGVLGKAARLAPIAAKAVPGSGMPSKVAKLAVAQGVAVGTTAGVLTGAQALERAASGDPRWDRVKGDLAHNLAVVAVLHGTNAGFAKIRPDLAPGGPTRAELRRLSVEHGRAMQETNAALGEIDLALERGDVASAEAAVRDLAAAKDRAVRTRDELSRFANHSIGPKIGSKVDSAIAEAERRVTGEPELIGRVAHQQQIQGEVGRQGLRDLSDEIGGRTVERLHDNVGGEVVKAIASDASAHAPLAEALADVPASDAAIVEQMRTNPGKPKTPAQVVGTLEKQGDVKRFLAGQAEGQRTQATREAASQARVNGLLERARDTGFLERADVNEAMNEATFEAVRGLFGEHMAQLEARANYPASEGHEVLGGVKVYEAIPDATPESRPKASVVIDGKVYRTVTDIDTLVLKEAGPGAKPRLVYLEQQKTGAKDTHAQAAKQNKAAADALRDLHSGARDIVLLAEGRRNITQDIDAGSIANAEMRTRGPTGKGFDLDAGATARELGEIGQSLYAEGQVTP